MRRLTSLAVCSCLGLAVIACSRQPPTPTPTPPTKPVAGRWLGTPVAIAVPASGGARFPRLASAAATGNPVVMSWLEPGDDEGVFRLRYAQWQTDNRWGTPVEVAGGRDWFINWADFPSVVPSNAGPWVAHWLQQKPGGVYAYDVMVRLSNDAGRTWSEPRSPHDDGTPTEHGFVSLAHVQGQPYAVWLDGRRTAGEGHAHGADHHGPAQGAMTVRGASLTSRGATDGREIDDRVCDCCQTDVATTTDALVLVYRDRSRDETRNMMSARLVDGAWSTPVTVHADDWRIDACPVNGPAVAALGDTVAVAWFTAPDLPRVRLAFSTDGGRSFAAPIEVASGRVVGRVDVVLLEDGRAIVSWLADAASGAVIRAQPFTPDGPASPALDIAGAQVARASGFPQLARVDGGLLFAWTESGATPMVHTVFAALP